MNKVNTEHKSYPGLQTKRDVFHAVKGGTNAIRDKGKSYLPEYPAEKSDEYQARLKASTIDGIVSGGCDTLSGAVFYGDIDVSKVNSSIQPLLENIDNKGNSFNVFARQAFDAAFDGSAVILIDAPKAEVEIKSLEDEKVLGIRPYWRLFYAKDVINWRYRVNPISMATELEMIVFHEPKEEVDPKNSFGTVTIEKYRVYYFDGVNVRWELWRQVKEKTNANDADFIREDSAVLENKSGKRSGIPVSIIGCLEDEPRLLVESHLEVKAYQKESSFDIVEYMSIPQLTLIGRDDPTVDIPYGAGTYIDIPVGGDAKYVQIDAAGHTSLKETIASIKEYIRSRLNELTTAAMGGADKTATEVSIADRDKQARLIVWAEQFKDALELALGFTAEAMGQGKDKGGEIVLQTKWEVAKQEQEEAKARQAEQETANIAATAAKAAVSK